MSDLTTEDRNLIERLRKISPLKRKRLVAEAEALDAADAPRRAERLRHLQRAMALWPRSDEETRELMAEIEAAREIEE